MIKIRVKGDNNAPIVINGYNIINNIYKYITKDNKMEKENIVKKVCAEFNINQRELAEIIGIAEGTIRNWSSTNELPLWGINFINTLLEHKKEKEIVSKEKEIVSKIKEILELLK